MARSQWTGKLFVFRDDHGEHVSLTSPTQNASTWVRAYVVRGPFIPIGLQKTITLPDTNQWLGELQLQGFTCEPCTLDS